MAQIKNLDAKLSEKSNAVTNEEIVACIAAARNEELQAKPKTIGMDGNTASPYHVTAEKIQKILKRKRDESDN